MSNQYLDGAHAFIDISKIYVNEEGLVRCPCRKFVNGLWQPIEIIEAHIIDHGFNLFYKKWRYHRETNLLMDPVVHEQGDNMGNEMLTVLKDVIRPTHELPTKDENPDTFVSRISKVFLLEFFSKVDALKSVK